MQWVFFTGFNGGRGGRRDQGDPALREDGTSTFGRAANLRLGIPPYGRTGRSRPSPTGSGTVRTPFPTGAWNYSVRLPATYSLMASTSIKSTTLSRLTSAARSASPLNAGALPICLHISIASTISTILSLFTSPRT